MPSKASQTVNPLHFEDLEPHRFEDLIRQLAYGFREWSRIEATGRLGQDAGTDIRAIEVVAAPSATVALDENEDVEQQRIVLDEREWRIQCKRYKQMGPKFIRGVVAEAIPDAQRPSYGLIVAAACDVSAQTMIAFHEERLKRGVREGHLWTKAHIEDLLFLPENDHLLFAYFGFSLSTRRKSQLQKLQAMITLKRKLLRAFDKKSISDFANEDAIIRDISDSTYPQEEAFIEYESRLNPPWFPCSILRIDADGLILCRYSYDGWVKPDNSWDFLPDTAFSSNQIGRAFGRRLREDGYREELYERKKSLREFYETLPEGESADINLGRYLPFSSVLEIDPIGDIYFQGAHLYCRYGSEEGPFEKDRYVFIYRRSHRDPWKRLELKDHKPLFSSLGKKRAKDQPHINFIRDLKKWYYDNL
jgi:hypothetical protein